MQKNKALQFTHTLENDCELWNGMYTKDAWPEWFVMFLGEEGETKRDLMWAEDRKVLGSDSGGSRIGMHTAQDGFTKQRNKHFCFIVVKKYRKVYIHSVDWMSKLYLTSHHFYSPVFTLIFECSLMDSFYAITFNISRVAVFQGVTVDSVSDSFPYFWKEKNIKEKLR